MNEWNSLNNSDLRSLILNTLEQIAFSCGGWFFGPYLVERCLDPKVRSATIDIGFFKDQYECSAQMWQVMKKAWSKLDIVHTKMDILGTEAPVHSRNATYIHSFTAKKETFLQARIFLFASKEEACEVDLDVDLIVLRFDDEIRKHKLILLSSIRGNGMAGEHFQKKSCKIIKKSISHSVNKRIIDRTQEWIKSGFSLVLTCSTVKETPLPVC